MDYDRNDALLHWIFRQTQADTWFRPNEEYISSGVALRISDREHPLLYSKKPLTTDAQRTWMVHLNFAFFLTKTLILSPLRPRSPHLILSSRSKSEMQLFTPLFQKCMQPDDIMLYPSN